jgi:hypothetical protein
VCAERRLLQGVDAAAVAEEGVRQRCDLLLASPATAPWLLRLSHLRRVEADLAGALRDGQRAAQELLLSRAGSSSRREWHSHARPPPRPAEARLPKDAEAGESFFLLSACRTGAESQTSKSIPSTAAVLR